MDSNGDGDVARGCSARKSRVHDDEGGSMSSGGPHAGDYCRREQWGQSLDGGGGDVAAGTLAPTAITGVPSLQQWKVPVNVVAPPALTTITELSP